MDNVARLTRADAAQRLGLPETSTREELHTAWKNRLFDHKNHVLRQVIIPRLLMSRVQKIEREEEAFTALLGEEVSMDVPPAQTWPETWEQADTDIEVSTSFIDFIRAYEGDMARAKLALSQAWESGSVRKALAQVFVVQLTFEATLNELLDPIREYAIKAGVQWESRKQAEQLSTTELRQAWQYLGLSNSESVQDIMESWSNRAQGVEDLDKLRQLVAEKERCAQSVALATANRTR